MTTSFTESVVESAALAGIKAAGWRIAHGPDNAPDIPVAERCGFGKVVLAALHDTMQPKLICGKLRINNVKSVVERAE